MYISFAWSSDTTQNALDSCGPGWVEFPSPDLFKEAEEVNR